MKTKFKSKLLSILLVLVMLLTLGLGIGLQNSLVLKVYATEPDNALANIAASELQIVLHKNDHSTVNTTFAGGKYLHINGAYETLEINDSSAGADMEYDVSTGTLKLYDTDNMAEYEGKLSLYGLNESDKQLIIEDYYNGFTFYNLAFEKGNLTIENTSGNTNSVGSFGWKNKFKLNGELTIRGNTRVYLWLGATGYNYDVNNIIEVGTLKLLGNSSLYYTADVSDDVYAIVSANSLVLDTDGELYLDAEDAGGLTRVLSTNDVTLTKCKKITLVAPDSYDTTLTNSTYLRNAVTTAIPGYYASITQQGDIYDGYHKTYRLVSDSLYFSVSFDANDGSGTMAPVKDVQGNYILPGCTLVPPKYDVDLEFQCWTDKSYGGSNYAEGDSFFLYKDMTFYAKWKLAGDHTVSFDANGGEGSMTGGSYKGGYALPACSFTAPSGKQFKCWALGSASGMQFDTDATYYLYKDVTFYAIWEDITYTVSFNANGGSGTMLDETEQLGGYVLPECTFNAPTGKQFKCWAEGSASGQQYDVGYEYDVTANVTFYAVWEDIPGQHVHSHGSEWKTDAENHWNECACGDKANVAPHADTNNDEKCDTCSYAMPKSPSNNETEKPTEKPTDATESEKDDSTETEAPADKGCGGCGSSAALSALAIVAVVGSALVIKKKSLADLLGYLKK